MRSGSEACLPCGGGLLLWWLLGGWIPGLRSKAGERSESAERLGWIVWLFFVRLFVLLISLFVLFFMLFGMVPNELLMCSFRCVMLVRMCI